MVMRTKEVVHDHEKSKIKQGILARRLAMVGSGAALTNEANGAEAQGRPAHLQRNHSSVASGLPLAGLSSGIRAVGDCVQPYHRWAKRGIWAGIFRDLTSIVGTHDENSIDSTIIKAHRYPLR